MFRMTSFFFFFKETQRLMALIDYWGHRVVARAFLPFISQNTLVYGSSDQGNTVVAKKEAAAIMKKAGELLSLKGIFLFLFIFI